MDTIGDMLTIIRNGYMAKKSDVSVPHSRLKEEIARKLEKLGSVEKVRVEKGLKSKILNIKLRYINGDPVVTHIKRISKPGLRIYKTKSNIKPILEGMGFSLISTSKGIKTNRESFKSGIGGEIICEVW